MEKSTRLGQTVCNVLFVNYKSVDRIVYGTTKVSRKIILKNGMSFENIPFVKGKIKYESVKASTVPSILYNNSISGIIAGDANNMPDQISRLDGNYGIVVFQYNSGEKRTFGTIENPVLFFSSFSSNDQGYQIELTQKDTNIPFIYEL